MEKRLLLVNCYLEKRGEKIRPCIAAILDAAAAIKINVLLTGQDDEHIAAGATVHRHQAVVIAGAGRSIAQGGYFPEFLDFLRSRRIPVLGIGYGHGLLAKAFGARVQPDSSTHRGDEEVYLTAADPLFSGFPKRFAMRQNYSEIVCPDDRLSRSFNVLAVAADGSGSVQAMRHQKYSFWGVQFHPEQSGDRGRRLIGNFLSQIR